jgi:hypothetical protein
MQGPNCGGPSLREGVQFDGTVAVLEHEFGVSPRCEGRCVSRCTTFTVDWSNGL